MAVQHGGGGSLQTAAVVMVGRSGRARVANSWASEAPPPPRHALPLGVCRNATGQRGKGGGARLQRGGGNEAGRGPSSDNQQAVRTCSGPRARGAGQPRRGPDGKSISDPNWSESPSRCLGFWGVPPLCVPGSSHVQGAPFLTRGLFSPPAAPLPLVLPTQRATGGRTIQSHGLAPGR